ncbi:MAG: FIG01121307: hypothetical protein, partial [uncultured Blastococcus sp.]
GRPVHPVDHRRCACGRRDGCHRRLPRLSPVGRLGQDGRGRRGGCRRPRAAGALRPRRRLGEGRLRPRLHLGRRPEGVLDPGQGADAAPQRRVLHAGRDRRPHRGHLLDHHRPRDPDARDDQAQGREGHPGHGSQGAQEARRGL